MKRIARQAFFSVVLIGLAWSGSGGATPFNPERADQILERLPTATTSAARELRRLREQLAQEPDNLALAAGLARRYIELGRVESDPRYYGYAQGVLQRWWALDEPPSEVLLLRATLRQNRHEFDDALQDLSQLLARDRRNAQGWLTLAVILQVRGDYASARRSCLQLMRLDSLLAITCLSNGGSLSGQAQRSYEVLRRALESSPPAPPQERLWSLTTLAEIAVRIGKGEEAERLFKAALSESPHDPYLLADYADFLLDQRRATEVQALLRDATRIDALLLRLALVEQQLESSEAANHIAMLQARFAASRLRGDTVHQGDEARFTLHLLQRPQEALRLAQANWVVQKEPRDARILLEAALAAGDPAAARPVLEMLKKTSMEDVQLARLAAQFQEKAR